MSKIIYKVDGVKLVKGKEYILRHAFLYASNVSSYKIKITDIVNAYDMLFVRFHSPDTAFSEIVFNKEKPKPTSKPTSKSSSKSTSKTASKSRVVVEYESKYGESIQAIRGGSISKKLNKRNRTTMKLRAKK